MVRIEGPTTAAPNEVVMLRFVIESATRMQAGFNIGSTMGTLATSAPNTRVASGELTQSSTLSRMAGATSITIPFTWMAPNVTGAQTINAVGNAVNGNGANSGDGWNRATHMITVMAGTPDSGIVPPDSGAGPADSGVGPADSGVGPSDSGVAPADSGVGPSDSGAAPPADSGVGPSDSGVAADSGRPMMMTGGCGCTTAPSHVDPRGALAALAALGAIVTRRRARR